MAARRIALPPTRPFPSRAKARKKAAAKRRRSSRSFWRQGVGAIGGASLLLAAAALNFAIHPDALAAAMRGDIISFVPDEPSTRPAFVPREVDPDELRLLAATAWGEARSEGEDGMRAVAHVMVNRIGPRFGDDLETVIRAPKQFSAWNRGDPNRPLVQNPERYATGGANLESWETAQRIAREVLSGESIDPTEGALFYHTNAIQPWWSRYGEGRRELGAHVFYRDVPNQTRPRRARVVAVSDPTPREIEPEAPAAPAVEPAAPTPQAPDAIAP